MSKSDNDQHLILAMYLLKNRFNTPWDLLKYWGAFGPCIEECPSVEKIESFDEA